MKNYRSLASSCCLPILCLILSSLELHAQHGDHSDEFTLFNDSIPLYSEALGPFERPISTSHPQAQAYFNQGIQLKYAFAVNEAAQSFHEATKLDPSCAMCYWGEAWALGGYLNGSMSNTKAPHALAAIRKADSLSKKYASPVEKALIKAMLPRYVEDYDRDKRREQDSLYALAMAPVYKKYADDLDVATIYAEALFLLEPRRGTRDMDDPNVQRLHRILEKVLDENIEHPGACHLYIHATESTTRPDLGASCAAYLGNAIPGASHINHMPSHAYNEVGRWGESVRANLQAWHTDQKAKQGLDAVAIYPGHNLHMLYYSASFDGQGAIAIQAAKDFHKMSGNPMHLALALIRFGRFDEVLEVGDRPKSAIPRGMWDFAQGYAHLKEGEPDFAKAYLNRVQTAADTSQAIYREHPARHILGVLGGILEGEMAWMEGDSLTAIQIFQKAVALEDSMMYDEPEPMPFAARHWLGSALLEMGQFAQAETAYIEELKDHPNNGWSLYGLLQALKGQGKPIDEVKKQFEESWARSDCWIRSSRF